MILIVQNVQVANTFIDLGMETISLVICIIFSKADVLEIYIMLLVDLPVSQQVH